MEQRIARESAGDAAGDPLPELSSFDPPGQELARALGGEDVFRSVLDAAPDAMLVVSGGAGGPGGSDGIIRYANVQAERLFGYARAELEGRRVEELVPEPLRGAHQAMRAAFHACPTARPMGAGRELLARRRDGSVLPVEISLSPVPSPHGALVAVAVRDRSERLKTELMAQHLAALVASSEDAIISETLDGVITSWNPAATRIFGYTADEIIGQRVDILFPPDRGIEEIDLLARIARGESVGHFETQRLTKDHRLIDVAITISQIRDFSGQLIGASKLARDITARKQAEVEARRAHERLASAVESIQGAVALFDAQDRLVLCNSTYRLWFGASTGEIVGRSFTDILDRALKAGVLDLTLESPRELHERILGYHRSPTGALDVRTAEGRQLRVVSRKTPEGGSIAMVLDITGDVVREEELRRARAAAEAASHAKSEFLSSMSHELRTPLNAILGFAQLLSRDKRTPLIGKQIERVEHVLKAGEHLLHLIDDVLDLARIEAGRVTISMEPVLLSDVLAQVDNTLRPMAERAQTALRVEANTESLPAVVADRTRLAQILMNFASNAIKYGRSDGSGFVEITARQRGDRMRIAVRDNGIGIPRDKQDKVFQPFQRAGQETGPIQGTGIGLAISKRLASLMNGSVGFRSQEGEGSEFWLDLAVDKSSVSAPAPRRQKGPRAPQGARYLVLYIEDNPSNIALMQDIMNDVESLALIVAPTAEIGLELARARHPDLIIMDIHLPGMSGTEAAKRLREWPETRDIPVIALTAAAMLRDARSISEAGIGRVLTKPVQVDELLGVLSEYLKSPPPPPPPPM
ncbi:MAG: PAS domain S-box protein [Polyangia bacterium]